MSTTVAPPTRPASFEEFAATRRSAAVNYATSLTGDRHEAEDVVQEALGRLWRRWESGSIDNPWGYLLASIRNATVDRHRRRASERSKLARAASSGPTGSDRPNVEDRDELVRAMSGLPLAQRRTVALRYLLDMSEIQTAQALGVSPGAAKSNAARGISKLRRTLETTPA